MEELINELKVFIKKALGVNKIDYTATSNYGNLPEVAIWTTAQINAVTSGEITRLAVFRNNEGEFFLVGIDDQGRVRNDLLPNIFPVPEPCPPRCGLLSFEILDDQDGSWIKAIIQK